MKYEYCLLLLGIVISPVIGQDLNLETFLDENHVFEEADDQLQEKLELLSELLQNPINLNQTSPQQLENLFFLKQSTREKIWNYITDNSPLLSIYELQAIKDIELSEVEAIQNFVITKSPWFGNQLKESKSPFRPGIILSRIEFEFPNIKGIGNLSDSNVFLGSPIKFLTKMKFSYPGRYSFGLNIENDIGEPYRFNKQNHWVGFDYTSFHIMIENNRFIKKLLLGDFTLQFGQGLVLGNGFSFGKGNDLRLYKKVSFGIRPYTSISEAGFFRGSATTIKLAPFLVTGFYSRKYIDANLTRNNDSINSIIEDGMHRTKRELSRKNETIESNAGFNLELEKSGFSVGANLLYTKYELPLVKSNSLYHKFSFDGSENLIMGLHSSFTVTNFNFFGEIAWSDKGFGFVGGFISSISKYLDFSITGRNYQKTFVTLHGSGLREQSNTQNEQGILIALKLSLSRKFWVDTYFDRFHYMWLLSRVNWPSNGYEYVVKANYNHSRKVKFYIAFKSETKELDSDLNLIENRSRHNLILNSDYSVGAFDYRTRIQLSNVNFGSIDTHGTLMLHESRIKIRRLKLTHRFTIFDTDDFLNRQYVFEKDVLYKFSLPFYSGSGISNYLIFQVGISKGVSLSCKYRVTSHNRPYSLPSGYSYDTNHLTTFQIVYRL